MNRRSTLPLAASACLVSALVMTPAVGAADEAKAIADKLTAAGSAMFDARDAKGLSLSYAADARLEIISKDGDTGELKTEIKVGRNEVEAYYQELFKSGQRPHARNTVEHARLVDPDLLTFAGTFEPDTESAESLKLPFIQVRHREADGGWKIVSLQLFIFPQK